MPSLKSLRLQIHNVKSTQKITLAMKMVASAKLKQAQRHVEGSRPYTMAMSELLGHLSASPTEVKPFLLTGRPGLPHLVLIMTSDRGLCGSFNANIVRYARAILQELQQQRIPFKIFCVGKKGRLLLVKDYQDKIVDTIPDLTHNPFSIDLAHHIADGLIHLLDTEVFGYLNVVHSIFKSALHQEIIYQQLIPSPVLELSPPNQALSLYEYEPGQKELLNDLLRRNLEVQIYQMLLENYASEQGARMVAMDGATRNAQEIIRRLRLTYNQLRQNYITKELIEIISGAEALAS